MTTSTGNAAYSYHLTDWTTVRDCLKGERKIKEQGETYLPKLSARQKPHQYEAYKKRARFIGATARTLEGFMGSAFRKAPTVDAPPALDGHLQDIDLGGTTLEELILSLAEEVLSVGRAGILVEHQAAASGRAYLVGYEAEEILDWATTVIDGRRVLSYVELSYFVDDYQEGSPVCVEERRRLCLTDGVYTQEVLRYSQGDKTKAGEWQAQGAPIRPTIKGKALNLIPFVFLGPKGTKPEICEPPLLKIAQLNVHHYMVSANLGQALHGVANPTPYSINAKKQDDDGKSAMEFGPGVYHEFEGEDVFFGFAEITGAGLELVRQDLQDLKDEMASLGAAFITPPKRAAETAEALQLKSAANNSPLSKILSALEKGLTQALRWLGEWEGIDRGAIEVRLNKDFDTTKMSPAELQAMMSGLQEGSITAELFAYQLEQSEMLPPGVDAASYAAQLTAEKEARAAKALQISKGQQEVDAAQPAETPAPPPAA